MDTAATQADLRKAHVNGAAGVLVSGLVWIATGLTWRVAGPRDAFLVLFFGGVAIAPVAALLTRLVFKAPPPGIGRRREWIALATVPIILAGFLVAWRRFGVGSERAIPIVAIAVGLRYLTFRAMFGAREFLWLGGTFIATGAAAWLVGSALAGAAALALGLVELAFAAALHRAWRGRPVSSSAGPPPSPT